MYGYLLNFANTLHIDLGSDMQIKHNFLKSVVLEEQNELTHMHCLLNSKF